MSVTYMKLMAMSKQQTQASDAAAQTAMAQRQRRLEVERREQEAREKRDREVESRIRLKKLQEQQREEERLARKEQEREAREREIAKKEAEQRNYLLHGPKRSKSEQARPRDTDRSHRGRRSSQSPEPGLVLTREELRQQKRTAALKRTFGGSSSTSSHRSSTLSSSRHRTHLRGGAVSIVTSTPGLPSIESSVPGQSAKERIAAVPLTLTKLNTVKRDLRTIDEILTDRQKAREGEGKVLSGESAKEFSDWFTKKKKDNTFKAVATPPGTPGAPVMEESSIAKPLHRSPAPAALASAAGSARSSPAPKAISTSVKLAASSSKDKIPNSPGSSLTKSHNITAIKPSASSGQPKTASQPTTAKIIQTIPKKRARSVSLTPAPAPKRQNTTSGSRSYLPDDVFSLITGGRKRDQYVKYDNESEESDMEADAASQEREELYSTRIARKEDEEALLEIKKHEEEKRRKKKERDLEMRKRGL